MVQQEQEGPEKRFARRIFSDHGSSTVRVRLRLYDKTGRWDTYSGNGFVVYSDSDITLIMSCGHNFEGYRQHSQKDLIFAEFGQHELEAELVFMEVHKEVSLIRLDRVKNKNFEVAANHRCVQWSGHKLRKHELVGILSFMNDPEGCPVNKLSGFAGTVTACERVISFKLIPVNYIITADYACVQGNSGSPIYDANGVVGIHVGGANQTSYFLSLDGVKIVLKQHLSKSGVHGSDAIEDLISEIARKERLSWAFPRIRHGRATS